MLTSLRIQNFRSIRDASVKLGQVNLFIGPNNSGKSNFLKGIEEVARVVSTFTNQDSIRQNISAFYELNKPRFNNVKRYDSSDITFRLSNEFAPNKYCEVAFRIHQQRMSGDGGTFFKSTTQADLKAWFIKNQNSKEELSLSDVFQGQIFAVPFDDTRAWLRDCIIYKPDPAKFQSGVAIVNDTKVSHDAANLVVFVFQLSQNYKSVFRSLETDLARCIGNLVAISTPADPNEPGKLKLKFFDQNDVGYWAEEVSEGVLYFLALLCIVHQPDPPKLLLLEEPEKGIHPRRIREVMDFIFELARLRDIQIILTSHSPYVVDHFADIPECISVFDRENGETVIRNAGDIITETNAKLQAEGQEPIHYTDALGEYWVSGFLGGVPEVLGSTPKG